MEKGEHSHEMCLPTQGVIASAKERLQRFRTNVIKTKKTTETARDATAPRWESPMTVRASAQVTSQRTDQTISVEPQSSRSWVSPMSARISERVLSRISEQTESASPRRDSIITDSASEYSQGGSETEQGDRLQEEIRTAWHAARDRWSILTEDREGDGAVSSAATSSENVGPDLDFEEGRSVMWSARWTSASTVASTVRDSMGSHESSQTSMFDEPSMASRSWSTSISTHYSIPSDAEREHRVQATPAIAENARWDRSLGTLPPSIQRRAHGSIFREMLPEDW